MADINYAKKRKREDEDAGIEYYRSISMYDIRNALNEKILPLSLEMHLLNELLHYLTIYMDRTK
jgi:hypothetical protein